MHSLRTKCSWRKTFCRTKDIQVGGGRKMTDESCLHNMPLSDQIEYLNQWCLQLGIRRKQIRKKIMKIHTEITELEYDTMKLYKEMRRMEKELLSN